MHVNVHAYIYIYMDMNRSTMCGMNNTKESLKFFIFFPITPSYIIYSFHYYISGGGEIFCTHPDRPWGPPSLLYNGYWVFPGGGVKRPRRGIDHPLPSNAKVNERVELYLCSLSGPLWPVLG